MRTIICIVIVGALAWTLDARAQSDVPEIAQNEVARRGAHVEQTGTIRSGLMAAALAPPADDSAKWFLTLVFKPGDPASERMRSVIAGDPAFRPWVDVRDPLKSTLHYHVRSIDDATQADWLKGLKPAIQRSGVPLVVLQPPKNGQFGPTSTIVKIVAGVVSGEELGRRLREGVIAYVRTIEQPGGISQAVVSAPAPFEVPPKDPPIVPLVPLDWPPANPPEPARQEIPTSWLAMIGLGVGMFVTGWVSARLTTLVGEKIGAFNRVLNRPVPRGSTARRKPAR